MTNDIYWLWLQQALGQGLAISPLIKHFGSAKDIYASRMTDELELCGLLSKKLINKLRGTSTTGIMEIQQICDDKNWQIISYESKEYPSILKDLVDPPAVIYVDGKLPDFNNYLSIGVVGARAASKYAEKVSHFLCYSMALCGAIIVSGGAMGVDAAAHNGALSAKATTVAVLGSGFGTSYLVQNQEMRQQISETGALISEYPPFHPAHASNFPIRNRLISGLSQGVVVVEANIRSGSLITANRAIEQGKDVYAVPGSIISNAYLGTSQLISQGAGLVLSPLSILEPYVEDFPTLDISKAVTSDQWKAAFENEPIPVQKKHTNRQQFKKEIANEAKRSVLVDIDTQKEKAEELQNLAHTLTAEQSNVYNALSYEYQHIDLIINKIGANIKNVAATLIQLELCGLISATSGKRYRKE